MILRINPWWLTKLLMRLGFFPTTAIGIAKSNDPAKPIMVAMCAAPEEGPDPDKVLTIIWSMFMTIPEAHTMIKNLQNSIDLIETFHKDTNATTKTI